MSVLSRANGGIAALPRAPKSGARKGGALRVLYIDIEGGWGGSSRSLFCMVAAFDRTRVDATIWHRTGGPISQRLDALGLAHGLEPRIASIVPRSRNNWKIWLASAPRLLRLPGLARSIMEFDPDLTGSTIRRS